jgi:hypothetical protein
MASYTDLAGLCADASFQKRLAIAVAKFATYILGEAPNTPNHTSRFRWAQSALLNTTGVAAALAPAVVLNDNIQAALAEATDADVQSAVELAANYLLM